ncbi:hypothetical protein KRX56_06770 [Dermabacteraceae bacterium TAE3-ERU27]|nr:hypothetical protein [Dermabacteraceae bacterium TAE3-ERU27]
MRSFLPRLLLLAAFCLGALAPSAALAQEPLRLLFVTANLSYTDAASPGLRCLASHGGVSALATGVLHHPGSYADGLSALRTGNRPGDASEPAHGHPAGGPLGDGRGAVELHLNSGATDTSEVAAEVSRALRSPAAPLVTVYLPDGAKGLDALLSALGGCENLPRTALVSVADAGPGASPGPARLQAFVDTGFPAGSVLISPNTRQPGVALLADARPTLLGAEPGPESLGRPLTVSAVNGDSLRFVTDRSLAARAVLDYSAPALVACCLPGFAAMLALGYAAWRGKHARAWLRTIATSFPLVFAAGLYVNLLPWWRADHPGWALAATLAAFTCAATALSWGIAALSGRLLPAALPPEAVSGLLVALLILGESVAGSPLQLAAPLGADPLWAGRFYGVSNHLFGTALAGWAFACIGLLRLPRRWAVPVVLGGSLLVALVCVAPGMGADFGSLLATLPFTLLLAAGLLRIRLRPSRVFWAGVGTALAVLGVAFLDWLRPVDARSHLGRFFQKLLDGEVLPLLARKSWQNLTLVWDFPALLPVLAIALACLAAVACRPSAIARRWGDDGLLVLRALALAVGIGMLVNDTGTVLAGMACAVTLPLLASLPGRTEELS